MNMSVDEGRKEQPTRKIDALGSRRGGPRRLQRGNDAVGNLNFG
jgi:hypothetical protein